MLGTTKILLGTTVATGAGVGFLAQALPETPTTVLGALLLAFMTMVGGFIWLIKSYYPDQQQKAELRLTQTQDAFREELKEFRSEAKEARLMFAEDAKENRKMFQIEIREERDMAKTELQAIGAALTDIKGHLVVRADSVQILPKGPANGNDPSGR